MPTTPTRPLLSRLPVPPALPALVLALALPSSAVAQEAGREAGHGHDRRHDPGAGQTTGPLEAPGNAAFAAIQEVVRELNRRQDVDWTEVDLEALRRHLRDMHLFTLEARVVGREPVDGGLRVAVRGTSPEATRAVRRSLRAHGPVLEKEEGWEVTVTDRGKRTVLRVTSSSPAEVEKIRALGYIGLMATGAHHQRHHWMIATGRSPHGR